MAKGRRHKAATHKSHTKEYVLVEVSHVTCYFRHLVDIFKKAGIEVTSENKRQIDKLIHKIAGVEYKNCPATWREVKKKLAEDEQAFVSRLSKDFRISLKTAK